MTCLKSQQLLHYTLWGSNVLRGLNLSPWFVFFVRLYDILEKVPRDFEGFREYLGELSKFVMKPPLTVRSYRLVAVNIKSLSIP